MGSSTGVTRGQLRPHFSSRSPPFVLAALCVGLGILGVSYWSLSQEYNQLEEQLKKILIRKDSIENDLTFIQKQLNVREEEFSRAQQTLQKKEQDLTSAKTDIKSKAEELHAMLTRIESLKDSDDKCNEELNKKTNELADTLTKLKEIQQKDDSKDTNELLNQLKEENKRLETQLEVLRNELSDRNATNISHKNDTNFVTSAAFDKQFPNNDINAIGIESNKSNMSLNKTETVGNKIETDSEPKPNVADNGNDRPEEAVVSQPLKDNQLLSNALPEEDRKEEGIVEANDNEMGDPLKADVPNDLIKDSEDKQNI